MSDGQGGDAPGTIDDLAQFLADTPDADGSDPALEEGKPPATEPDKDNPDGDDPDLTAPDPDGDPDLDPDPNADPDKPQTSDLKFKVPVKGEDGQETTVEVDQKELIAGYQRHADYTRKTMELGDKEREITKQVATKLEEGRAYYLEQAQLAHAAVRQLAGLRTPEEMSVLAQTDPSAWVAEQQRQQAVAHVLSRIEQGTHQERAEAEKQQKALQAQAYEKTWTELSKDGIDKPKLKAIFDVMKAKYQVPDERLANVYDPVLVRIMRDAAAFQELKDKKATVTKKAVEAPRLPTPRQSVPKNEQLNKSLNAKFSSGRAKLSDLAKYLENN